MNTFCSPAPETTNVGVTAAPCFMQYGSEPMLIGGFAGGVPSSLMAPLIAPAVAGSTGFVTTAAGAGADDSCGVLPPPQALPSTATQSAAHTLKRIACIEKLRTLNYCTPPTAM